MHRLVILVCFAGCRQDPNGDVVGPFVGTTHRYVVDGFSFPANSTDARLMGDDLDGNGSIDNAFGQIASLLVTSNDTTKYAPDMINAGVIASTVEIVATDLTNDATVGVRYIGGDGDPTTVVGGTLIGSSFRSNRTRTTQVPGKAIMDLPIFADADPITIEIDGLELDLTPDHRGGYDGLVRGAFHDATAKAFDGLARMMAANPHDHRVLWNIIDANHDGMVTRAEYESSAFLKGALAPDITLPRESTKSLSAGYQIHLSACDVDHCTHAISNTCFDRILDGDEADIDCGGSCAVKCPAAASCVRAGDCQTAGCDAGRCRAASCTDGVRDNFESDIDCGGGCPGCAVGRACSFGVDCASHTCSGSVCLM